MDSKKYIELNKKYEEQLENYIKLSDEHSKTRQSIKDMQAILKSGGKCDGLCGLCLLFDEGCLVWNTVFPVKKGKK